MIAYHFIHELQNQESFLFLFFKCQQVLHGAVLTTDLSQLQKAWHRIYVGLCCIKKRENIRSSLAAVVQWEILRQDISYLATFCKAIFFHCLNVHLLYEPCTHTHKRTQPLTAQYVCVSQLILYWQSQEFTILLECFICFQSKTTLV